MHHRDGILGLWIFSMFLAFIDVENWIGKNGVLSFLSYTKRGNTRLRYSAALESPLTFGLSEATVKPWLTLLSCLWMTEAKGKAFRYFTHSP